MAVVTYVNQKYFMPKPTATLSAEQQQTQKMTQGMSMFFPLMFYSFPSGLNLYYLTSMTIGVIESKIVRDHIKATRGSRKSWPSVRSRHGNARQTNGQRQYSGTTPAQGLIARLMERLQNWVEEIRKSKAAAKTDRLIETLAPVLRGEGRVRGRAAREPLDH